jgi:hypothetical protein
MIVVTSDPVVDDPPEVDETAPWPWTVTVLVKFPLTPTDPVQVQVPAGMETISPSCAAFTALVTAVCTSDSLQVAAVNVVAQPGTHGERDAISRMALYFIILSDPSVHLAMFGHRIPDHARHRGFITSDGDRAWRLDRHD